MWEECPECGGKIIKDEEHGEMVCTNCGLVIDDLFYDGPDHRAFDAEQWAKRPHIGPSNPKYMTTKIYLESKDASGKKLTWEQRKQIYRIRMWQERSRVKSPYHEDNFVRVVKDKINNIASKLNLQRKIISTATELAYKVSGHMKGRYHGIVACAIIYLACRLHGEPIPLKKIAKLENIKKDRIARTYKEICRITEINPFPNTAEQYIEKFCNELSLSDDIKELCRTLYSEAKRRGIVNSKNPIGIACSLIYIACKLRGIKVTQKNLMDISGVTEVTIRNRYREIVQKMEDVIEKLWEDLWKVGDETTRV